MLNRWLLISILLVMLLGGSEAELPVIENAPAQAPCRDGAVDLSPRDATNLYSAGPALTPGWYNVWLGKRTGNIVGRPDVWEARGPVELLGGKLYVLDIVGRELNPETPEMVNPMLSDPLPDESIVWYRGSTENAYVVCFEGTNEPEDEVEEDDGEDAVPGEAPEDVPEDAPEEAPEEAGLIFDNGNIGGVENAPTCYPSFTLEETHVITKITNYHWNYGQGSPGGSISLRDDDGRTYGPWEVTTEPGQGGVPNAYWIATPDLTLPPGHYTIEDSDSMTWAQNYESEGCGFSKVEGYPILIDDFCDWTGTWNTDWGELVLEQMGDEVTGEYTHDQGRIEATAEGDRLVGTWSESPSYSPTRDAGDVELTLSDDCVSFSGSWRYGSEGDWSGTWSGTRVAI